MITAPVIEIGRGMLRVHAHVGKVADGLGVKQGPQRVLDVIAIEIRLDVKKQASLHGHAAAVEPAFVEIINRVAILIG